MKTEILYGAHPVMEALKAEKRKFFEIYTSREKVSRPKQAILNLAEKRSIPIRIISPSKLQSLTGGGLDQGIGAKVTVFQTVSADFLKTQIIADPPPLFLILDHIIDPQNCGAIIRTAHCAGVSAVIIPKKRAALPTPAVSKASAGALEHMTIVLVSNISHTLKTLKDKGVWITGTDSTAEQSLFAFDLKGPLGIIIGGEEKGIRSLVKKQCDFLLSLPLKGKVESLNASAAAAVVLYEALRQRDQ